MRGELLLWLLTKKVLGSGKKILCDGKTLTCDQRNWFRNGALQLQNYWAIGSTPNYYFRRKHPLSACYFLSCKYQKMSFDRRLLLLCPVTTPHLHSFRCVMKMDHHCPWINNCCGHLNHAYFTSFLLLAPLGCSHAAVIFIMTMYTQLYERVSCHLRWPHHAFDVLLSQF